MAESQGKEPVKQGWGRTKATLLKNQMITMMGTMVKEGGNEREVAEAFKVISRELDDIALKTRKRGRVPTGEEVEFKNKLMWLTKRENWFKHEFPDD